MVEVTNFKVRTTKVHEKKQKKRASLATRSAKKRGRENEASPDGKVGEGEDEEEEEEEEEEEGDEHEHENIDHTPAPAKKQDLVS